MSRRAAPQYRDVGVNRGTLAGCGFAVRFLKAIAISVVAAVSGDARDYDDAVRRSCFRSRGQVALDLEAMARVTGPLGSIDQVLGEEKEQVLVQSAVVEKAWRKFGPEFKCVVGSKFHGLGVYRQGAPGVKS